MPVYREYYRLYASDPTLPRSSAVPQAIDPIDDFAAARTAAVSIVGQIEAPIYVVAVSPVVGMGGRKTGDESLRLACVVDRNYEGRRYGNG